jgi:hypothetical protein
LLIDIGFSSQFQQETTVYVDASTVIIRDIIALIGVIPTTTSVNEKRSFVTAQTKTTK